MLAAPSKVQELPVMSEDPAPSALLQHAMQMVSSAEEEEQSLIAESAAAYTQLAEAQVLHLHSHQCTAIAPLFMSCATSLYG